MSSRRDHAARLLAAPVLRSVIRRVPRWRGTLVLNYHRIGDPAGSPWDHDLWSGTPEALDTQLALLAREAEVIGPGDVAAAQHDGRAGRRVLLTFDDGYRDNYELAFPLLRHHGLTATFFPVAGFLDDPCVPWWDEIAWMVRHATAPALDLGDGDPGPIALDGDRAGAIRALLAHYKSLPEADAHRFLERIAEATGSGRCPRAEAADLWMTWDMVRELRAGGMAIGGHTMTHPMLPRISTARQHEEVGGCARRHAEELGEPMEWFAYPVGEREVAAPEIQQVLREHGVRLAFSFYGGWGDFTRWDPLDVPRVHVGPSYSVELLRAVLAFPARFGRW